MAVYTQISHAELSDFLKNYPVGVLQSFSGIAEGVSNTNYHVHTDKGRYVLTLFEPHRVAASQAPFFVDYQMGLKAAGISVPDVLKNASGQPISTFKNRPAILCSFLPGQPGHAGMVTPEVCRKAGVLLARMHRAFEQKDIPGFPENAYGIKKWVSWVAAMGPGLNKIERGLFQKVSQEIQVIEKYWPDDLPAGPVHGDFFPDNVFFDHHTPVGVIDFHFAATDFFVYDLSIAVNAWCFDMVNIFSAQRFGAMLDGYESVRPLTPAEDKAFALMRRAAALRFLLSRCEETINYNPATMTMKPHDPLVFLKRLHYFSA